MGQARHFAVGPGEISCRSSTTGTSSTVLLQQEQGSDTRTSTDESIPTTQCSAGPC